MQSLRSHVSIVSMLARQSLWLLIAALYIDAYSTYTAVVDAPHSSYTAPASRLQIQLPLDGEVVSQSFMVLFCFIKDVDTDVPALWTVTAYLDGMPAGSNQIAENKLGELNMTSFTLCNLKIDVSAPWAPSSGHVQLRLAMHSSDDASHTLQAVSRHPATQVRVRRSARHVSM